MLSNGTIFDPWGVPCNGRYQTLKDVGDALSAAELIRLAQEHPPEPMIKGLLNKGDILLLHGSEESFKSVFILQIAESLAKGTPLLNYWVVPRARRVGVIETEMHEVMLGERLGKMFPKGGAPKNLFFMPESTMREWRRQDLTNKFGSIQKWVAQNHIEVLMIDTANDFFRGQQSSSDERHVGGFFDELRNLNIGARIIVRHNRKRSQDPKANVEPNSNENIRGSGEWKEDPEAIIALERKDRRTHEVSLEVGKLRYGTKPDPLLHPFAFEALYEKSAFERNGQCTLQDERQDDDRGQDFTDPLPIQMEQIRVHRILLEASFPRVAWGKR